MRTNARNSFRKEHNLKRGYCPGTDKQVATVLTYSDGLCSVCNHTVYLRGYRNTLAQAHYSCGCRPEGRRL